MKKKIISLLIVLTIAINYLSIFSFAASNCCDLEYWEFKNKIPNSKYELWVSRPHINKSHGTTLLGREEHINIVLVDPQKPDIKLNNYHVWKSKNCINYWDSKSGDYGSYCVPDLQSAVSLLGNKISNGIQQSNSFTIVGLVGIIVIIFETLSNNKIWSPI